MARAAGGLRTVTGPVATGRASPPATGAGAAGRGASRRARGRCGPESAPSGSYPSPLLRKVVDRHDPPRRRALGGVESLGELHPGLGIARQVRGEGCLGPQLVGGVLIRRDTAGGGNAEPSGDGESEIPGSVVTGEIAALLWFRLRVAVLIVLVVVVVDHGRRRGFGQEGLVDPERNAVGPPVDGDVPSGQRFPRIPLALAVVEDRTGEPRDRDREPVDEAPGDVEGEAVLGGPDGGGVPLVAGHVVDRDKGRLAAQRQAHVARHEVGVDRPAEASMASHCWSV